jgi:hypothetical protein
VETKIGENHGLTFLFIRRIHSFEAPNSQFFSFEWKEATSPYYKLESEGSCTFLNSLDPNRRRLQPHNF